MLLMRGWVHCQVMEVVIYAAYLLIRLIWRTCCICKRYGQAPRRVQPNPYYRRIHRLYFMPKQPEKPLFGFIWMWPMLGIRWYWVLPVQVNQPI